MVGRKDGNTTAILGVSVFSSSKASLLTRLEEDLSLKKNSPSLKKPILVFTPNPEMLLEVTRDAEFRRILNKADYNIPDGIGLVWISKILSLGISKNIIPISERISGADLFYDLIEIASKRNLKVFLLGAGPTVAAKAAKALEEKWPELKIESACGPQSTGHYGEGAWDEEMEKINKFKTDLLFVALGHKKQEAWITRYQSKLNVRLAMGVGGTLDYVSGNIRRAPGHLSRFGLEWLYRLLQEPSRLPRIINALIVFPVVTLIRRGK